MRSRRLGPIASDAAGPLSRTIGLVNLIDLFYNLSLFEYTKPEPLISDRVSALAESFLEKPLRCLHIALPGSCFPPWPPF
jgi:hypothetical protein